MRTSVSMHPGRDVAPASTPASTSRRRRSETTHLDKDASAEARCPCPQLGRLSEADDSAVDVHRVAPSVHHCEIGLVRRPKRPVERPPIEAADRSFRHRLSGCPRRLRLQSRGSRHALNSLRDYRPGGAEAGQEPGSRPARVRARVYDTGTAMPGPRGDLLGTPTRRYPTDSVGYARTWARAGLAQSLISPSRR